MTPCPVRPTLFALCALLAAPAWAQSPAAPDAPAASAAQAPSRVALGPPAARAEPGAVARTADRTFSAAGSLITVADGAVTRARLAQIAPPAPGFVYER